MKLLISAIFATTLLLVSCKKEPVNPCEKTDSKPAVAKTSGKLDQHPFYVRHKTYRKNLNSPFMNHLGYKTDEGC